MDIESLFARLHTLPSIPKVAQELIQQFDNPSSSLESVARNIERDPVIAAKVLRLANSPRFRAGPCPGSRLSACSTACTSCHCRRCRGRYARL